MHSCPHNTAVIGAGVAGLSAAIALAARDLAVTVYETSPRPGGKIRSWRDDRDPLDTGPTVFTMPWVFDDLLAAAGTALDAELELEALETLAHHRWPDGSRLDLYADRSRSADAIGHLAGAAAARQYRQFCNRAQRVYDALNDTFLSRAQPGLLGLIRNAGVRGVPALAGLQPFRTLWDALGAQFDDMRLRQLFARYATYCGSSPFAAPATLMLIAHVEQLGVFAIRGGMVALARALERVALRLGVEFRYETAVSRIHVERGTVTSLGLDGNERVAVDRVVVTADKHALAAGLLGPDACAVAPPTPAHRRSLSALTWAGEARVDASGLDCHNVLFSNDYPAEFRALSQAGEVPAEPTVYVHVPDRRAARDAAQRRRVFVLINAPARGDRGPPDDIARHAAAVERQFGACGIDLPDGLAGLETTGPADFHRRFPGTGGALYGAATHGWRAAFLRPGNRTAVRGLYLAGGSVHPGPGVPMAALSGRLAARCLVDDLRGGQATRRVAL